MKIYNEDGTFYRDVEVYKYHVTEGLFPTTKRYEGEVLLDVDKHGIYAPLETAPEDRRGFMTGVKIIDGVKCFPLPYFAFRGEYIAE